MRRCHPASERQLPPVQPHGIIHAQTGTLGLPQQGFLRRRLLRAVLPEGIRRHCQQEETILRLE